MRIEPKSQWSRHRRFETTRWSLVLRAGRDDDRQAASMLCGAYWLAARAFFRSQGAQEHEADEITQDFFAGLDRRRDFRKVDRERGRFRSWLCACAKNHLSVFRKRQNALKRGGDQVPLSLDAQVLRLEPSELRTPEHDFNLSWALALHARVVDRLRAHYGTRGQLEIFTSLEGILSGEGSEQSDADLSTALGKEEGTVRTARCRMNKGLADLYRHYLRAEIGETVLDPEDIDDEIRELLAALSQATGAVGSSSTGDVRASP
jgi:DNA-directed RNA polymerase specialized sigma24 family protein